MADSTEASADVEATELDPASQDSTDWKAEARKWEDRAKSNRDAMQRVETLETQLAETKSALAEATEKVTQFEVAQQRSQWVEAALSAAELDSGFAGVLRGDTLEALTEHAEALKAVAKPKGTPVPDAGKTPETKTTPERAFARDLFRGNL